MLAAAVSYGTTNERGSLCWTAQHRIAIVPVLANHQTGRDTLATTRLHPGSRATQ